MTINSDDSALHCRLCSGPGPLRQSHIVPKFAFDWLRTQRGGLRDLARPDLVAQDGTKPRLLCGACEGLLAAWERQVSENLFRPLHQRTKTSFPYGPWLLKFAVSVSFRVLALHGDGLVKLANGPVVSSTDRAAVTEVGSVDGPWAGFLRGERETLGPYEHYCVALPPAPDLSPANRRISSYFEGEINIRPPTKVSLSALNPVLRDLGQAPASEADLAPVLSA